MTKFCNKCQTETAHYKNGEGECSVCNKRRIMVWRQANKEKISTYNADYWASNTEKERNRVTAWRETNKKRDLARMANIQLLRGRCNLQKRAKHPVDFMQSRGFLI